MEATATASVTAAANAECMKHDHHHPNVEESLEESLEKLFDQTEDSQGSAEEENPKPEKKNTETQDQFANTLPNETALDSADSASVSAATQKAETDQQKADHVPTVTEAVPNNTADTTAQASHTQEKHKNQMEPESSHVSPSSGAGVEATFPNTQHDQSLPVNVSTEAENVPQHEKSHESHESQSHEQKTETAETETATKSRCGLTVDAKRNRKIVTSLAESFLLEEDCFDEMFEGDDGEEHVHQVFENMLEDSLPTAFSGIEAAGTSTQCLRAAWASKMGCKIPRCPVLHQIEWDTACLDELVPHAKVHDTCVFQNIAMFFRPELQEICQKLLQKPSMSTEILGPLLANGRAMKRSSYCLTHSKTCVLRCAKRHVAGTSCHPFSTKGSKLGVTDPELVFTLGWVGLRIELQEERWCCDVSHCYHGG